jgi:hypothetical protein
MGFNIAVIAVNKNVKNNFDTFAHSIGIETTAYGRVDIQEASANRKSGFIDAYFTENGSLLFVPMGDYQIKEASKIGKIASFIIDETSMSFVLRYAENGKLERMYTESDGEIYDNEGSVLAFEKAEDFMDRMSLAVEEFTGKGVWDFDKDMAERYRIIN